MCLKNELCARHEARSALDTVNGGVTLPHSRECARPFLQVYYFSLKTPGLCGPRVRGRRVGREQTVSLRRLFVACGVLNWEHGTVGVWTFDGGYRERVLKRSRTCDSFRKIRKGPLRRGETQKRGNNNNASFETFERLFLREYAYTDTVHRSHAALAFASEERLVACEERDSARQRVASAADLLNFRLSK